MSTSDEVKYVPNSSSSLTNSQSSRRSSLKSSETSTKISKLIDFDEFLTLIGEFGIFQGLVFAFVSLGTLAESLLVLVYVFVAAVPEHWCAVPELDGLNLTLEEIKRLTLPIENVGGMAAFSSCRMYERNYTGWTEEEAHRVLREMDNTNTTWNTSQLIKCSLGWSYDRSVYSSTIVTEWDLVCDDAWMASFGYTILGIGQMVGSLFWGPLSDRFGRKYPYYMALTLMIGFALGESFSPNYTCYCVLQFIIGVNTVACFALGETMAIEISGVTWRGHISTAVNYYWTIGFMLLPGIAYAVRDWWKLQFIISASSLVLLLPIFFVPESPRWLYCKNRRNEADDVMRRITRFNKVEFPEDVQITCTPDEDQGCDWFVWKLFRTNRMRMYTLILGFNWFVNALCYYGISLLLPPMTSVNGYLAFFVSGAVELPGYVLAQVVITRAGRKWPLIVTLALGGACLLCTWPVPTEGDLSWLALLLSLLGKLCITASWGIAICFTAELYPTVIRGAGMFLCTLCGNIANAAAPQMGLLVQYGTFIPFTVFGVVALLAACSVLLLPETKDDHLPDSVKQAEQRAFEPMKVKDGAQPGLGNSSELSSNYTEGTYTTLSPD